MAAKRQPTRTIKIGEKTLKIAKIVRGRKLPPKDKIEVAKAVCLLYQTDQYTLLDCLNACGINSFSTWHIWRKEIEEIENLYLEAQQIKGETYKIRLKERSLTMAERLISGYTVTLIDETYENVTASDVEDDELQSVDSGIRLIRPVSVTKKRVFVRPSVRLIEQMLYNLDSGNFNRNPDPEDQKTLSIDIPIISWVDDSEEGINKPGESG